MRFNFSGMRGGELSALSMSNQAVKLKTLPVPGSLFAQMSPPIISTNRFEMESPNPVPPKRRVIEPSAWVKG